MTNDIQPIPIFMEHAKKYKLRFLFSLSLMPISAWLAVKGPSLVQDAIDNGIKKQDISHVLEVSYIYLIVLAGLSILQACQNIILQTSKLFVQISKKYGVACLTASCISYQIVSR